MRYLRQSIYAAALLFGLGCYNANAQSLVNGQAQVAVMAPQPPFQRLGGAFAFPVSTVPQTYAVTVPDGAHSYRGVNQCYVDIVVSTVTASLPAVTQSTTFNGQSIPGVQTVTSQTGSVDYFSGTVYLARTSEALGSTPNLMPGSVRYISIMALSPPSAPCLFRLGYGNGG